jgi:hypothetical protein
MSADDALRASIPDGEIHAAVIDTVDEDEQACAVLLPAIDGGDERSPTLDYQPHLVVNDGEVTPIHPTGGDRAVVLEDNRGGLWLAAWRAT